MISEKSGSQPFFCFLTHANILQFQFQFIRHVFTPLISKPVSTLLLHVRSAKTVQWVVPRLNNIKSRCQLKYWERKFQSKWNIKSETLIYTAVRGRIKTKTFAKHTCKALWLLPKKRKLSDSFAPTWRVLLGREYPVEPAIEACLVLTREYLAVRLRDSVTHVPNFESVRRTFLIPSGELRWLFWFCRNWVILQKVTKEVKTFIRKMSFVLTCSYCKAPLSSREWRHVNSCIIIITFSWSFNSAQVFNGW